MSVSAWSHDYCLGCDKQIDGGSYCSQTCRLADFEKGQQVIQSPNHQSQSRASSLSSASSTSSTSAPTGTSGFLLSPAINFTLHRGPKNPALPVSSHRSETSLPSKRLSAPGRPVRSSPGSQPLTHLDIRPSQTPFSSDHHSTASSPSASPIMEPHISESARQELRQYDNAFDTTRRRRQQTLP